jgi:hypothetical protein
MLLRERILEQLHSKRAQFRAYDSDFQHEAEAYARVLAQVAKLNAEALNEKLAAYDAPGALATEEFNAAPSLALPFAPRFAHHEAARAWAHETLLNHTTLAVDGSQILPAPELNIPIAAAQVAWFVNSHAPASQYEKNLAAEILAPDELLLSYEGETKISEQLVHLRRFELEAATLCRLMRECAATQPATTPLAFFDSSLVVSFVEQVHQQTRARYLEAIRQLLRCSQSTRVPLVGYVDNSHARDLTRMLAVFGEFTEATRLHDAHLLNGALNVWGMRSPYFLCARGSSRGIQQSVLEQLGEEFRREIGFVYLKTNSNAPARLEIPRWVADTGLIEEVVHLVRAEVIVGNGYPYALEAADATAVLSGRDREMFYELFRRFAESEGLALRAAQKALSKVRRR